MKNNSVQTLFSQRHEFGNVATQNVINQGLPLALLLLSDAMVFP